MNGQNATPSITAPGRNPSVGPRSLHYQIETLAVEVHIVPQKQISIPKRLPRIGERAGPGRVVASQIDVHARRGKELELSLATNSRCHCQVTPPSISQLWT